MESRERNALLSAVEQLRKETEEKYGAICAVLSDAEKEELDVEWKQMELIDACLRLESFILGFRFGARVGRDAVLNSQNENRL